MRYAVIPTRNRPDDLRACLDSLNGQVSHVVVIDNGSEPPLANRDFKMSDTVITIIRDSEQPPNLSRLWNIGIKATQRYEGWENGQTDHARNDDYWIAIVNDDCIIPAGWVDLVISEMDTRCASAGATTPHLSGGRRQLWNSAPRSVFDRLTGWAFILDGSDGILANEDLRWWYGDNDIDMKARAAGGTVLIDGPVPFNRYANSTTTGILAEQAGKDRALFESLYGPVPW